MPAPRFRPPDLDTLTAEQRRVYEATRAGRRGTVPANVLAWLPSPELAERAQHLGAFLRYDTALGPRLSELAILVVARRWLCTYEWAVHAAEAARAGWPESAIAAIGGGGEPAWSDPAEASVFAVARHLAGDGRIPDAVFASAEAALGRRRLVDLVGLVGYYTMVAMTLNAFDVPAPPGAPTLP
ncbi:MAG: carboxymuconolactone decarboxylase family protein [Vicinamibacterales bacterium]